MALNGIYDAVGYALIAPHGLEPMPPTVVRLHACRDKTLALKPFTHATGNRLAMGSTTTTGTSPTMPGGDAR